MAVEEEMAAQAPLVAARSLRLAQVAMAVTAARLVMENQLGEGETVETAAMAGLETTLGTQGGVGMAEPVVTDLLGVRGATVETPVAVVGETARDLAAVVATAGRVAMATRPRTTLRGLAGAATAAMVEAGVTKKARVTAGVAVMAAPVALETTLATVGRVETALSVGQVPWVATAAAVATVGTVAAAQGRVTVEMVATPLLVVVGMVVETAGRVATVGWAALAKGLAVVATAATAAQLVTAQRVGRRLTWLVTAGQVAAAETVAWGRRLEPAVTAEEGATEAAETTQEMRVTAGQAGRAATAPLAATAAWVETLAAAAAAVTLVRVATEALAV